MKTNNEIIMEIIETTIVVDENLPELPKYIEQMPATIKNRNVPEINETTLKDYQSSLDALLNKYAANHNRLPK